MVWEEALRSAAEEGNLMHKNIDGRDTSLKLAISVKWVERIRDSWTECQTPLRSLSFALCT